MGIPGAANPLLLASAASGYQIERSLRFNSADSAHLSRTPASAGNRKTWTWAGWMKRSGLGEMDLFSSTFALNDPGWFRLLFQSNNTLRVDAGYNPQVGTTETFRDLSAWYHIVLAFDTTQATATSRVLLYVNGALQSVTGSYPALNGETAINAAQPISIGRYPYANTSYLSGYLAEIHFIDGQALDPTSFGEFDTNGIWQPKAYTGTYGTNGFKLDFADNSSNTATTLGKDTSGNSNNFTPNNLSVTAGSGNDSLVDTPTSYGTDTGVGGEVRGNYATLNPLALPSTRTFSEGNLDISALSSNFRALATCGVLSGKWYWEVTPITINENRCVIGIADQSWGYSDLGGTVYSYGYIADARKYNNGAFSIYGASFVANDVIGVALDMDAGTLTFYKNGVSQGQAFSGITQQMFPAVGSTGGGVTIRTVANFGQRPFAYTAPSGFKALCTANIPEGTITTSGTFTGNANADGPFVYLNGVPTAMTINGNAVTFATHADKLSNGFKVRSSSGSYNTSGSNTYSVTTTGAKFKVARAQPNP